MITVSVSFNGRVTYSAFIGSCNLDFDAAKKVSSQYEVSDKNEKVRKKFYL
jgi:hypothetical protein